MKSILEDDGFSISERGDCTGQNHCEDQCDKLHPPYLSICLPTLHPSPLPLSTLMSKMMLLLLEVRPLSTELVDEDLKTTTIKLPLTILFMTTAFIH